jgi:hypothetical protein
MEDVTPYFLIRSFPGQAVDFPNLTDLLPSAMYLTKNGQ